MDHRARGGAVKICAISDQHGWLDFQVPECDVLLVAGDNCPDYPNGRRFSSRDEQQIGSCAQREAQRKWFRGAYLPWLKAQPVGRTLLTWGNHDSCSDLGYAQKGLEIPVCSSEEAADARCEIVVDDVVYVNGISIWLSPWSNRFLNWFNMKEPVECAEIYARIPEGTDVLVCHHPPYGYGDFAGTDLSGGDAHVGSKELLATIDRVRPKVVIGGHIHGGHGRRLRSTARPSMLLDLRPTEIYNVSVVDEGYRLIHPVTEIAL
jgi:hypothetical protein